MKSRIMKTIGLVAAMVACVGMTVFAAPSPSASTVVTGATAKNAKVVMKEVPAKYANAVTEVKSEAGLKKALGDDFSANMTVADVVEVSAESTNGGSVTFPIDITFNVKGVTTSTKGQLLHWNGSEWEKIPTKMGNGTMTGTFTSLSPVAFVVDKTTFSTATTSPATSATSVSTVAVLGLTAAVAALALKKKSC